VCKAISLTGTELIPRRACDAFVPALTGHLCHHFINHGSLLFFLHLEGKIRVVILHYRGTTGKVYLD